jgi:hypothetical protein
VIKPRKRLVDSTVAALYLARTYGLIIAPATVRSWATRGHIGRYGTGRRGDHYDLNQIDAYVRFRKLSEDRP